MKFAVVLSTGGSVFLNAISPFPDLKEQFVGVLSDRDCAGVTAARKAGYPVHVHHTESGEAFSDFVCEFARVEEVDIIFSFYTKLFRGKLLETYRNRIINFHPTLLPACPGRNGFERALSALPRAIGATAHFVDEGIDTGGQILQGIVPVAPDADVATLRHEIFVVQCKQLVQICDWLIAGRIELQSGAVLVKGADFTHSESIPQLDSDRANAFSVRPETQ